MKPSPVKRTLLALGRTLALILSLILLPAGDPAAAGDGRAGPALDLLAAADAGAARPEFSAQTRLEGNRRFAGGRTCWWACWPWSPRRLSP